MNNIKELEIEIDRTFGDREQYFGGVLLVDYNIENNSIDSIKIVGYDQDGGDLDIYEGDFCLKELEKIDHSDLTIEKYYQELIENEDS